MQVQQVAPSYRLPKFANTLQLCPCQNVRKTISLYKLPFRPLSIKILTDRGGIGNDLGRRRRRCWWWLWLCPLGEPYTEPVEWAHCQSMHWANALALLSTILSRVQNTPPVFCCCTFGQSTIRPQVQIPALPLPRPNAEAWIGPLVSKQASSRFSHKYKHVWKREYKFIYKYKNKNMKQACLCQS